MNDAEAQILVLQALTEGDQWGRDLQETLRVFGGHQTKPSFYEMMDRMEQSEMVSGQYQGREVLGVKFQERRYRIMEAGKESLARETLGLGGAASGLT